MLKGLWNLAHPQFSRGSCHRPRTVAEDSENKAWIVCEVVLNKDRRASFVTGSVILPRVKGGEISDGKSLEIVILRRQGEPGALSQLLVVAVVCQGRTNSEHRIFFPLDEK